MTGSDLEIVFNLWYIYDDSGTIHALRAKPYVLPGNDEDKLSFMEAFASSDFLIARQFPIPVGFHSPAKEGEEPSVFHVRNMEGPQALAVFEECMSDLIQEFPPQTELKLPPDPLVNLTPLFLDVQGNLLPVTRNKNDA